MEVFGRDEHFAVVGTLRDERPWAEGGYSPRLLHAMELGIVVRRADLTIVDAQADMQTFPHVECTAIEPHFGDLVGLSVGRGYTSAVQERFGRERGCSHLEFLARALGPTVIQATTSAAARQTVQSGARQRQRQRRAGPVLPHQHVPRVDTRRARRPEGGARLATGTSGLSRPFGRRGGAAPGRG